MILLKKIWRQLKQTETLWHLIVLTILLGIVWLVYTMMPVASEMIGKAWVIIRPFAFGFMIAYILNPLISGLAEHGIKRPIGIILVYVLFIVTFLFLTGVLLPAMIRSISEFAGSLITTMSHFSDELMLKYQMDVSSLTTVLINSMKSLVQNLSLLDNAVATLSNALNYLTAFIIYMIVSLYMLSGFDRIKCSMKKLAGAIHPFLPSYLASLDFYMHAFLRGMVTLMLVRLMEYGFMYLIIGHVYWKEMALFSAVTVFIPYVGPLLSALVGLLTAFGLPTIQYVVLVLLLFILFIIDSYVILPDVYSREINTHPVWILFAMVTGLNLFGLMGLLLSIPVFIAFRVAYLEYRFFHHERV